MTHRYELRRGYGLEGRRYRTKGDEGKKNWDNYNNIINKIYFKKQKISK